MPVSRPEARSTAAYQERLRRLAPWIVAALACAVFLNALANGYALDDVTVVAQNPLVHGLAHWRDIWFSDYWPNLPYQVGLYRPLTIMVYAVEWTLWHGNAMGFHLVNVLLHAVATVLVLKLLQRLGASLPAALAGGVIFAVHPLHVEAVAGVVGCAEVLMTLLVLAACLVHLRRRMHPVARWAAISALYLAALLVKESAVAMPLLLIVVDGLDPDRAAPLWRVVWDDMPLYLLMTAVLGGYLGLRFAVLGVFAGSTVAPMLQGLPASGRIATAFSLWPEYLRLLVFPRDLVADYGPNVLVATGWSNWHVWAGVVLGVVTLGSAVVLRRRVPWWTAAVAWFAASVFVVSNLLVPVGVLLAERTLYLPSVAVALAVVPLADLAWRHRRVGLTVGLAIAALAAVRTWTRTPVWRSTHTLLAQLAAAHQESFEAQAYLGAEGLREGRPKDAVRHYAAAWALLRDPHIGGGYAHALLLVKDWGNAERVARASCSARVPEPCLYLIDALLAEGRPAEARAALDSITTQVPPAVPLARRALAVANALGDSVRIAAAREALEALSAPGRSSRSPHPP